ncbi:MAG: DinB family protein [Dehalococcoidia bacterium]
MDALQMLLLDHARTHAAGVGEPEGGLAMGELFKVDDAQMRMRPGEGLNSLAWLVFHIARTEDLAVNILVAGRPQVWLDGDWPERLGIDRQDMTPGMTDVEVGEFTGLVDLAALREYRNAVGRRSIEVVSGMKPEELDEQIDHSLVKQGFANGTISPNAAWLDGFTNNKTKAFILGHTMTAHNFMHLGEAFCLRSMMGLRVPV